ncbi:MAG: extracellular solute-binding protein [Clostridia bacterium]|nr:extracellular solute-binding protein [Clostridia bacterium]
MMRGLLRLLVVIAAFIYFPLVSGIAEESSADVTYLYIEGSNTNAIDQRFEAEHPNVVIRHVSSDTYEGMTIYEAILSHLVTIDVCYADNTSAAEAFLNKGYALDLSQFPSLKNMADAMYEPIRSFAYVNDALVMIPCDIQLNYVMEYREAALTEAGLTADDVPQTFTALLEMMIDWSREYGDKPDVVPILFDESPHSELLLYALNAYITSYKKAGEELAFDTEEFRTLLDQVQEAAQASFVQTADYNPARLFMQVGRTVPGIHTITFPLRENETPRFNGNVSGWMIYSGSQHAELAAEYIAYRMSLLSDAENILLYDGQYEPVERDDFQEQKKSWEQRRSLLEQQLSVETDEVTKHDLEDQIQKVTENIENPSDTLRYAITVAEISFYQQDVIPNMGITYQNQITESSFTGAWAQTLIKQYVNGVINKEAFIRELDQRVQMMRMEEN